MKLGFALAILVTLVLVMFAGCDREAPLAGTPGGTVALQAAGPGPFAWSADGGTITADGRWTAPACGSATFPATFTIRALSALGEQVFTVRVEERVLGVEVVGAVVVGESVLRPQPVTLAPGQSAQFYARVQLSCHAEFKPSTPPGF